MYRRIRDLREDSDLTQKSLADYLSCSQVCYSNYETGKRDVPSDVLIRLARFYHTSVDYLVGLTEERAPYPKKKQYIVPCSRTGARGMQRGSAAVVPALCRGAGEGSAFGAARIKGDILFRKREYPLWNPKRKALTLRASSSKSCNACRLHFP